ncbi:D-alanyl-D-alanine carboxypeptidase/D-alanyl-D-alanine endopeptidase [Mycolicibacterium litorale]|uniref:D-alanyl-D-alanine carboxypeptidase n=1 Tax=Mycolicibacterium litorale TaxID=758802 RepID=A0AAD1MX69_9MYCO|nr:D-alanyl-D-alanine carboxypeptidase/D-alanyl-D-alanine-endopeptidase [Mycolicibacterium litorale]MCV7417990.1 D-alanyl-D-alanine carboxypeptidase/D-alanyl-D-alanine-endopeptidase [Mycolicibacterium litorale]TDY06621.1 D-alanyl-D-alanine carboxypeptidase/D-alanyl-D-alanine-endopeptidase (penicillin-binding protein 4) [Mycolicibacterium litorale]BBY19231.1 D-alanyl-D-alanine carboxypeptidase [Mycolicibacterium litorale]
MRPTRWRRSTRAVVGLVVLVLVAVVVAVAAVLTTGRNTDAQAAKPLPAPATANPAVVPVADTAPAPTNAGLAAALAPALADPNLGDLAGRVTDAMTGERLWDQRADVPMQPASTNKVLTAAAALLTLDREARLTTTVVAGDQKRDPGLVILKGGGDPTLSAAPRGTDTWYKGAARISDLADQVRRSGIEPTAVAVDVSAYTGPDMAPGWDPLDIPGGDIAPMVPVMLDAGRTQPVTEESRRSPTPADDAGRALATALRIDPATVRVLPGPYRGGRQIAAVQSPPLMERLRVMMNASDNVMAEAIGREVADQLGRPQSFEGATQAVLGQLRKAGVDTRDARLFDSSGLSIDDRLTALTLDEVITIAAGDEQPALRPLVDLLPIAGGSGTLSNRYLDTPAGRDAAGWLRAKTGSLTGTNSLAGIVTDARGRVLTFALMSNNAGPTGRTALDALAATLRACGCGS